MHIRANGSILLPYNGSVFILGTTQRATHATFKRKHTNRSRARSRSGARTEVSEGYWGSNIFLSNAFL